MSAPVTKTIRIVTKGEEIACLESSGPCYIQGTADVVFQLGDHFQVIQSNQIMLRGMGKHRVFCAVLTEDSSENQDKQWSIRVALKFAVGNNIIALKRESAFYEKELLGLQGIVVPRFYGFFHGTYEDEEIACMVLEWCGGHRNRDIFEDCRQRMLAAIRLHAAGIMHGKLTDSLHFVPGPDGRLRIVGFSVAMKHSCEGSVPLLYDHLHRLTEKPQGCVELDLLEEKIGMLTSPQSASRQGRFM